MVLAYVVAGIFAGMVSFVTAVVFGASFWFAIFLYSLVGAASIPLFAFAHLTFGNVRTRNLPTRKFMRRIDAPRAYDAAAPIGPVPSTAPARNGPMRILAVDDDAFILELIPKIGAKVGCPDITTARSGAQALDLIETSSTPFDCLLLDINMPEMDGVQLCERIRSVEGYRDTPIIMLTAMNDMSYLDRAFRAGASDYTVKPFDIIEFGKRLQSAQARIEANASGAAGAVAGDAAALDRFGIQGRGLVPLAGVPALIEYPALQNYLTRLSGSALSGVYVMAVLADQPLEAEDSAQTEAPFEVLKQVALAIDTVLSPATYVMAYAGQGQFVLVANAARQPQAAAIESAIQDRLDVQTDAAGDTAPVLVTISAGSAVRPGVSRSQRARTAFETALNLAKDRAADKLGAGELGAGQTARLGPSGNR